MVVKRKKKIEDQLQKNIAKRQQWPRKPTEFLYLPGGTVSRSDKMKSKTTYSKPKLLKIRNLRLQWSVLRCVAFKCRVVLRIDLLKPSMSGCSTEIASWST